MGLEKLNYINVMAFNEDKEIFGGFNAELNSQFEIENNKPKFIDSAISEAKNFGEVILLRHKMSPDYVEIARLLKSKGFQQVDTNLAYEMDKETFAKEISSFMDFDLHQNIFHATMEDIEDLEKIAGSDIFIHSRFNDFVYPEDAANKFYSTWIKQDVESLYGGTKRKRIDDVLVYKTDNKVVGFATGLSKDNITEIVFVGVDKNYQRKGIGHDLCKAILLLGAKRGDLQGLVTMQADNSNAQRTYQNLGFKIKRDGAKAWYHLNLKSG